MVYRPALFHFPFFASESEIVFNNNETIADFNRNYYSEIISNLSTEYHGFGDLEYVILLIFAL